MNAVIMISALTWIDVADSATKIGLGAIVGGFFAIIVARYNHKSMVLRLQFERRSRMLEEVASKMEILFDSVVHFSSKVEEIMKSSPPPTSEVKEEAAKLRDSITEKFVHCMRADAALRLLKENDCRKATEDVLQAINDFAYGIDNVKHSDSPAKIMKWNTDIAVKRERFYEVMSKAFN